MALAMASGLTKEVLHNRCQAAFGVPYHQFTVPKLRSVNAYYVSSFDPFEDYNGRYVKEVEFKFQEIISQDYDITQDLQALYAYIWAENPPTGKYGFADFLAAYLPRPNISHAQQARKFQQGHRNTRECVTCSENCDIASFPKTNCSDACRHEPNVCTDCLIEHVTAQINVSAVHISCPSSCPAEIGHEKVRRYAIREAFKRYSYSNYSTY
jgi:hypothetical protein